MSHLNKDNWPEVESVQIEEFGRWPLSTVRRMVFDMSYYGWKKAYIKGADYTEIPAKSSPIPAHIGAVVSEDVTVYFQLYRNWWGRWHLRGIFIGHRDSRAQAYTSALNLYNAVMQEHHLAQPGLLRRILWYFNLNPR